MVLALRTHALWDGIFVKTVSTITKHAKLRSSFSGINLHGSLNVPIEHHPTIRYMVYNGYYFW